MVLENKKIDITDFQFFNAWDILILIFLMPKGDSKSDKRQLMRHLGKDIEKF